MKKIGWGTYLFAGIGLAMLVGAAVLVLNTRKFIATAARGPGKVVELREVRDTDDGSITYKPVVTFTSPGGTSVTFESSFSSRPPAYSVGETVDVLFAPDDPSDARINGFGSLWFGPLILSILGAVFAAVGGGIILFRRRSERHKKWLMAYGDAIRTDFQGIERNTSLKVNGRSPWRIVSQWQNPESAKLHVFRSENLWFDPTQFVTAKQVTVLLDPKNPQRYYMDVSFLPQLAD
jgi:hypothetical protein